MNGNIQSFIDWERASRDTVDFKTTYVDMADGDTLAGLMLSEIVYWHLPARDGQSRLRVKLNGYEWLAVHRHEWWNWARLTPTQADRAIKVLVEADLIEYRLTMMDGKKTPIIRIKWETFLSRLGDVLAHPPANPYKAK